MSNLPRTRPQRRSNRRDATTEVMTTAGDAPADGASLDAAAVAPRRAAAKPRARAAKPRASGAKAKAAPVIASAEEPELRRRARPTAYPHPAPRPKGTGVASAGREPEGSAAVQAAGQLAQRGLTIGVRALRSAVSRLPRPR